MSKSFSKILQYSDEEAKEVLRAKTKEIKSVDNDVRNLFRDLAKLAKLNSKDGITLVGLSAPQVGWSVSAFVFFDLKTETYVEVMNPKVTYSSKEITTEWEGCASVGSGATSLFAPISRPRMCQITYTDLEGNEKIFSGSNFQSHILQHEMDHLDGILFLDKVADAKMIFTAKELDEYAKKQNGKFPKI